MGDYAYRDPWTGQETGRNMTPEELEEMGQLRLSAELEKLDSLLRSDRIEFEVDEIGIRVFLDGEFVGLSQHATETFIHDSVTDYRRLTRRYTVLLVLWCGLVSWCLVEMIWW